jgi:NACalpha-BTF3-like transcription factor
MLEQPARERGRASDCCCPCSDATKVHSHTEHGSHPWVDNPNANFVDAKARLEEYNIHTDTHTHTERERERERE